MRMRSNEELLAEIHRRGKQKISKRKQKIRIAVCCIPLVLSVGFFGMLLKYQGTPTALPVQTQPTEETDRAVSDVTAYSFCVVDNGLNSVCTDSDSVETLRELLNDLEAADESNPEMTAQSTSEDQVVRNGEKAVITFYLTDSDGVSRRYQLEDNFLWDCGKDKGYYLTYQQYFQLRDALGIDD